MTRVTRPGVKDKRLPVVTERQYVALLKTCDSSFLGRRDEAIVRLLWDTGLRVSESWSSTHDFTQGTYRAATCLR